MAGSGNTGRRRSAAHGNLREQSLKRREKRNQTMSVVGFFIRAGMIVCVFLIAYFLLLNSSFKVEKFEIEGNSKVSDADIITLSGISIGDNLFQTDVDAAEKQIGLHVLIDDVSVHVRPFHTILIEVTEKTAVAGFVDDKTYYYIDADKTVIGESETVDDTLPLFSGFEIPAFISIGLQLDDSLLNTDLTIANAASSSFSGYTLEISAQSESVNNIYLNGVEIRLGTAKQLEKKLTALKSLVSSMSQQKLESLEYIDISIPDEPVVKEQAVDGADTTDTTTGT